MVNTLKIVLCHQKRYDVDLGYNNNSMNTNDLIIEDREYSYVCSMYYLTTLRLEPVRGEWSKTFQVPSGLTFEQWIELDHPEHFSISNGYVYYDEFYQEGMIPDEYALCQSFTRIPATSIINSVMYAVGMD